MTKFAGIASIFLVLMVTSADANPIIVRSGDHDGFTRLVMRLPDNVQWQVTETRGLKTITLSDYDAGFDTSRVFDVIPQDRLTGVRAYPARIELELTCDCKLNTFVERNGFLVVDILDGPALPPLEAQQAPKFVSAQPVSRFDFGDLLWSDFSSLEYNTDRDLVEESEIKSELSEGKNPSNNVQQNLIDQTRERLIFDIGNATSRGILELSDPDVQTFKTEDESSTRQDVFDSSDEEVRIILPNSRNIRITNSRDIPPDRIENDLMLSGATCAASDAVNISEWGTDRSFGGQVAQLRDLLYSELDHLDTTIAKELAQLYLYFGFGAEAKQVLRMSDDLVVSNPVLMDIADIMDYGFARNPRFVHYFSDCDSDLALWSLLAAKKPQPHQVINTSAALRGLAKLPDHLKLFLAAAVSDRLSERGNSEAASIALRNAELNDVPDRADIELAQAKIETMQGNLELAEGILVDIFDRHSSETPEALLRYVDSRLAERKRIPADIALLVETYAFQMRSSPIAKELARAHVIASSYSGQFSKALEEMERKIITSDPELEAELISHTFMAMAKFADDISFLEAFYSKFPNSSKDLMPQSVVETAHRLLSIGFPADAEEITSSVLEENMNEEIKVIRANSLLNVGENEAVIDSLGGIESDIANYFRAEALLRLGQNRSAFESFLIANLPEEAARSAWLADEWETILPLETPILGEVRSIAEQPVAEVEKVDGMLTIANSTLQQVTVARETLERLIPQFIVSP